MSLTVYTAIFGKYDPLIELKVIGMSQCKFVCFTDQDFKSERWEVRKVDMPVPGSAVRSSRLLKLLPHRLFKGDTLWIDGNVTMMGAPPLQHFDEDARSFTLFRHPSITNIYREAVLAGERIRGEGMRLCGEQAKAYRLLGMPDNTGLYAGTILLRKDTQIQRTFNEAWWRMYCNGSPRDQLPLNFLIWLMSYSVGCFEGVLQKSTWHVWSGRHEFVECEGH